MFSVSSVCTFSPPSPPRDETVSPSNPESVLTAERFERLVSGFNPNWREAACVLIEDPQDWSAKEALLLHGVTDKDEYGAGEPPKMCTELLTFIHLRSVDADGRTRLVKLYTAIRDVLTHSLASDGGDYDISQKISRQALSEACDYFVQAREEINAKLIGANPTRWTPYKLIPSPSIDVATQTDDKRLPSIDAATQIEAGDLPSS